MSPSLTKKDEEAFTFEADHDEEEGRGGTRGCQQNPDGVDAESVEQAQVEASSLREIGEQDEIVAYEAGKQNNVIPRKRTRHQAIVEVCFRFGFGNSCNFYFFRFPQQVLVIRRCWREDPRT